MSVEKKRPSNPSEQLFWDVVVGKGWEVLKTGWPDFACWGPDGQFILVEVKPKRGHRLKGNQLKILRELSSHGISCFRWSPTGFEQITPKITEPMPKDPKKHPWRKELVLDTKHAQRIAKTQRNLNAVPLKERIRLPHITVS